MIITLPQPTSCPALSVPNEIDALHQSLLQKLNMPIQPLLKWTFSNRFTKTYGQAEFEDKNGDRAWILKYSRKYWLLLMPWERRNLVTHEICHLAVEYFHGYSKKGVLSHGNEWRSYMALCDEDPDMIYSDELRGADDEDIRMLSSLLLYEYEARTTKSSCKSK